ncbi:MAG: hypothetical protein IPG94_26655 [Kineosporiaceae bacterium]|nr:hypothetical protein [Kineosporiaceae bacterium]
MRRFGLFLVLTGLLFGPAPTASAVTSAMTTSMTTTMTMASASASVRVAVVPRRVVADPGFRRTTSGDVLRPARFTSVVTLDVPAATTSRGSVVLATQLRVEVPIRIALSVRAWCAAPSAVGTAPGRRALPDVLVIGQNPVPGNGSTQVASRVLTGRAVVSVTPGRAVRCLLQVSPRTESTSSSWLRITSGTLGATAARVVARAAQRPAVLVGGPGAPGVPVGQQAAAVALVAALRPVTTAARLRLEGEAELTTCALGYHLCGRGGAATSVVEVALVAQDIEASGRVCATWRGSARSVTITPAVHHVKVIAPALGLPSRCGAAVRGWLQVRHRGGNAVEVEPVLLPAGQPRGVQTHTWMQPVAG